MCPVSNTKSMSSTKSVNVEAIGAAITLLRDLTADDLLAVHKASGIPYKFPPPPAMNRRSTDVKPTPEELLMTPDEKRRARKNARQRAARATPEGRAYANEASKRSAAAKKHADEVALVLAEKVVENLKAQRARKPRRN